MKTVLEGLPGLRRAVRLSVDDFLEAAGCFYFLSLSLYSTQLIYIYIYMVVVE